MRRHARSLKADLEGAAGAALATGSGWALVGMAFLAVVREGFETAVFLVAAFNESDNPTTAATGALIGIVVACVLGYGIYQGGFRINLARFFRVTGVVLVLVAAGLVASAVHSAHEAGLAHVGQQQVVDLTWLVEPGFGAVVVAHRHARLAARADRHRGGRPGSLFLVPVLTFVLWPAGRPFPRRGFTVAAAALRSAVAAVAAVVLVVVRPGQPARPDVGGHRHDGGTLPSVVEHRRRPA